MRKVLFLDIDGVLNTQDWHSRMTEDTPKDEVSNYVIIDDFDDLLPEQMSHAVITNTLIGISESDANNAITILNNSYE